MSKIETASFIILILFSIFGVTMFGNIGHEFSHKNDLEGLVYDDEFCLLRLPGNTTFGEAIKSPIAYYTFRYSPENSTEVEEASKYTELKAYSFNAVLIFIFLGSLITVLLNRLKKREAYGKHRIYHSPLEVSAFDV